MICSHKALKKLSLKENASKEHSNAICGPLRQKKLFPKSFWNLFIELFPVAGDDPFFPSPLFLLVFSFLSLLS
jgi:hypothetical protein